MVMKLSMLMSKDSHFNFTTSIVMDEMPHNVVSPTAYIFDSQCSTFTIYVSMCMGLFS